MHSLKLLSFIFFISITISFSQTPGEGGGGCDICDVNSSCYDPDANCPIPIDGGVSLLIGSAVALGAASLYRNKKK